MQGLFPPVVGPVDRRPRRRLAGGDHRRVQPAGAGHDRLRALPPHGGPAAPDPDEARRRAHPGRHRRPHGHATSAMHAFRAVAAGSRAASAGLVACSPGWLVGRARRTGARCSARPAAGSTSASCSRSSTTCPTPSTSTCSARCRTSSSATSASAGVTAEAEPRGRRPSGASAIRAVLVEEPARHLRVHRVRALLELLPGVQHRQEPVADAAHPRHPLRDDGARCKMRSTAARRSSTGPHRTDAAPRRPEVADRRDPTDRRCRR